MDEITQRVVQFNVYTHFPNSIREFDRQRNKLCVPKIRDIRSIGKSQVSLNIYSVAQAHSLFVTVAINQKFVLRVPTFALETSGVANSPALCDRVT